jgi:uncharacterized protein YuzE
MEKVELDAKVWFDAEGDLLEVTFEDKKGFYKPLNEESDILVRVDEEGNVIGFMILNVSKHKEQRIPISIKLA